MLSEVGVIPAYLMGIQILKLRLSINKFIKGTEKAFLKDSVIKLSEFLNSKKMNK